MSDSELDIACMKGAVELEIESCLGIVTTRSVAMAFKKYIEPLFQAKSDPYSALLSPEAIEASQRGSCDE